MSEPITVADLAAQLDVTPLAVARRITLLIDELSPAEVLVKLASMRTTVITGNAADVIREQLADAAA